MPDSINSIQLFGLILTCIGFVLVWMIWQSNRREVQRRKDSRLKTERADHERFQRLLDEEQEAEQSADEREQAYQEGIQNYLDEVQAWSAESAEQMRRDPGLPPLPMPLMPTHPVLSSNLFDSFTRTPAAPGITTTTTSTSYRMAIDGEEVTSGEASSQREAFETLTRAVETHAAQRIAATRPPWQDNVDKSVTPKFGEGSQSAFEPEEPPRRSRYDVLSED